MSGRARILRLCMVTAICMLSCDTGNLPFERKAWLEGDYSDRGRMYLDLLDRYPMKGRSISEVDSLLGPPNDSDSARFTRTWYLDLGWTALFHMDMHVNPTTALVDSVLIYD